jgi:hypothetical protein
MLHVRICAGGWGQPQSLPRPSVEENDEALEAQPPLGNNVSNGRGSPSRRMTHQKLQVWIESQTSSSPL